MAAEPKKLKPGQNRRYEVPPEKRPISPRHLGLVMQYLDPAVKFNKMEAARRAGFSDTPQNVHGLFARRDVQEEIAKRQGPRLQKFEITAEKVLQETAAVAFARIGDMVKVSPCGKYVEMDYEKLTPEIRAAIGEFTIETYMEGRSDAAQEVKRVRFKVASKLQALELLGKHLKIFKENMEVSGTIALHERIAAGRRRIAARKTGVQREGEGHEEPSEEDSD